MKIGLLEMESGQAYPQRVFSAEVIKAGRDPLACHIIFDQGEWPMVSRRHAEFRQRDGRFLLADTGSRFGTFLDGRRIDDPCEIRVGARIQFGPGGPMLQVMELTQSTADEPPQPPDNAVRTRREQPITTEMRNPKA